MGGSMYFIKCGKLRVVLLLLMPFIFSAGSILYMMIYNNVLTENLCIWASLSHFLTIWVTIICVIGINKIVQKACQCRKHNDIRNKK